MYPQAESLATHGRAMYFRNGETVGFGNLDCLAAARVRDTLSSARCATHSLTRSARHQAAAQRNPRQINPLVRLLRAHKGEFLHVNAAAARKLCPAVTGSPIGLLSLGFSAQFRDGQMRHVRPLFMSFQRSCVEPVMKFSHTVPACATRIKTVGVTGTKLSTSPRVISKGSAWLQTSSRSSSAASSSPCRQRGGSMVMWAGR